MEKILINMSIILLKIGTYESNFPFQGVKKQRKIIPKIAWKIGGIREFLERGSNLKGGNIRKEGRHPLHTISSFKEK